ncbi:hypothetical protein [Hoyosella altamirensis]|uniref:Uncharacterized protein n=1 Tax=Hoyosella altamirensis TaxID=616997 RepID=A0A839RSJ3_9ACTN|nr:hypothetical protein [Hoyosella altamirensis]MBB3038831.1 hypothetical protein [Hoyosella altamirensis]
MKIRGPFSADRPKRRDVAFRQGLLHVAAILTLLLTVACSDPLQPETDETVDAPAEFTVPVPGLEISLVEPGAEPRQTLAPDLSEGDSHSTVVTVRSELFQQLGDDPESDFGLPPVTLPLDTEVEAADGSELSVALTLGRPESPDRVVNAALAAAEGSRAGMTIRADGSVSELRISPSPESDDIARSAVEQALFQAVYGMIAFPQEPVGEGAKWTIDQPIESQMEIVQRTTVTVREMSGTTLLLDLAVEQRPRLPYLDVPGEGRVAVDEFTGEGTGSLTVDLERPLPIEGGFEMYGTQQYSDPDTGYVVRQRTSMATEWDSP